MRTTASLVCLSILSSSALAQQQQESQAVTVGPWSIATTYKGDKFDYCTMTRSASGLGVTFVRNQDGLLLLLDSMEARTRQGLYGQARRRLALGRCQGIGRNQGRDNRVCRSFLQRAAADGKHA